MRKVFLSAGTKCFLHYQYLRIQITLSVVKPTQMCLDICRGVYYLCIENAEGYVLIAVYLFIYLYACSSHNSKGIIPNRMTFGGIIGYYPGTI